MAARPTAWAASALAICRRVATPSLSYLGTNVIRAGLPFFLIPFLTRRLSPAEYGITALYQTLILFIVPFVPFAVNSAIMIEYYKLSKDEFRVYVTSSLVPPVLICVALMIAFLFVPSRLSEGLAIPRSWLIVSPLFGVTQLLPNVLLSIYQVKHKALRFGAFTVGMSALNVALTVLFIAGYRWNWQGRLSAILWSQAVFSVLAFGLLQHEGVLGRLISWRYVREITTFCTPLIPHSVGAAATDMGGRFIIAAQLGTAAVGRYSIASQLGQTLVIFVTSLNQAWLPFLYRELEGITASRKREVVNATYALGAVVVVAFIGLVALAPVVAHIFIDKRYWPALPLVKWIGAGYMFNGFYYLIANYIFFAKRTRVLAALTSANAVVSVALTYWGVRYFGISGAAWAATFCWGTFFLAAWILSNRVLPMPWAFWRPNTALRRPDATAGV